MTAAESRRASVARAPANGGRGCGAAGENEMEADKTLPVYPAAAFRLLMLTGCRRNEIVTLRWEHVDLEDGELRLRDRKTGSFFLPGPVGSLQCYAVSN